MILELFGFFILMCFILIYLGFYTDIKVIALLGFSGLFLLGMLLQGGTIDAKSGSTETYTYMCLDCIGNSMPEQLGNTSVIATTTSTNNYTAITDNTSKWLGRWLAIISILAFILVIISNKGAK